MLSISGLSTGTILGPNGGSSLPTTNTNTSQTVNDTTIYIPQSVIQFTVTMMKPNTRLYASFDGKNVSQYIRPTGLNFGDALYTDANGYASGDFQIPNNSTIKFIAGQREFVLQDTIVGNNNWTTRSSAIYLYTGTTDNPDNPNLDVGSNDDRSNINPIIQSFICAENGGMFVSKVGLYFYQKDANESILLQLREVKEDKVLASFVPGSSVTINPIDITVSTNPLESTPTWINFPSPVYLTEGKEYAIFLVTNSMNYILHMVDYGQQTNSITATKDISSRSLIKYSGANNWIRENAKGLKYQIQKCKFTTGQTYTLQVANENLGTKLLPDNSIYCTSGSNKITIKDKTHSFSVGGFVTISGLPAGTYAGLSADVINGVHQITEITWDSYSFNNYWTGTNYDIENTLDDATSTLIFGTNISTDFDLQYNKLVLNMNSLLLAGTSMQYQMKSLSGQSIDGLEQPYVIDTSYSYIEPKVLLSPDTVRKVSSLRNSDKFSVPNYKSLQYNIALRTDNENVSPMIDKYNMNAIIVENIINNKHANEATDTNPDAAARYIQKTIKLYEPGTGIKVKFYASVQANSNVYVYYKTVGIDESASIDNKNWEVLPLERDVAKSLNESDFQEYNFMIDELPAFRSFKIKVVMTSPDSCKVPLIKKLAAIGFSE